MQPVNLEPWLERERSGKLETMLLYREARQALAWVRAWSNRGSEFEGTRRLSSNYIWIGPLLTFAFLYPFIGNVIGNAPIATFSVALFAILAFYAIFSFYTTKNTLGLRDDTHLHGFMALISHYRTFAQRTVSRISNGALGNISEVGSIGVCIDELDKMPDIDEVRVFIRRLKKQSSKCLASITMFPLPRMPSHGFIWALAVEKMSLTAP